MYCAALVYNYQSKKQIITKKHRLGKWQDYPPNEETEKKTKRKRNSEKLSLDFFCILTKLWVNVLNNLNDFVVLNCYGYKEASCFLCFFLFSFLLGFLSFRTL